jgi:hypothetical protein
MTPREQDLISLMIVDRAYVDRVRHVDADAVAATESRVGFKFCKECGRRFEFKHPAEKFCGAVCRAAPDKRRYRVRTAR